MIQYTNNLKKNLINKQNKNNKIYNYNNKKI